MKILKHLFLVTCVCFIWGIQLQAQSRLRGNNMSCGTTSEFYIWHDANENITATPDCWSVTGASNIEYSDNNTKITVTWGSGGVNPTRKVTLLRYYSNGMAIAYMNPSSITVMLCGVMAGNTYTNATSSTLSGGASVIQDQWFTLSGNFTVNQSNLEFLNCEIHLLNNATFTIPSTVASCKFTNCKLFMGTDSYILVNSANGEVTFDRCNIENRTSGKWNSIKLQTSGTSKVNIKNSYITGASKALWQLGKATVTLEKNVFDKNDVIVSTANTSEGLLYITSNWFPAVNVSNSNGYVLGDLSCNNLSRAYINYNIIDKRRVAIEDYLSVEVKGNKITGGSPNFLSAKKVYNQNSCAIAVSGNTMKNTFKALDIASYHVSILDNVITNETVNASTDYSIRILNATTRPINLIKDNRITTASAEAAIYVSSERRSVLLKNEDVTIQENTITVNQSINPAQQGFYGAIVIKDLSSSSISTIYKNNIKMNSPRQYKSTGITVDHCAGINTVEENTITNYNTSCPGAFDQKGVHLISSPVNVKTSQIKGLCCGIYIQGDCYYSKIKCNTIAVSNYGIYLDQAHIQTQGSATVGNASGNFWVGVTVPLSGTVTQNSDWYWCNSVISDFCRYTGDIVTGMYIGHNPLINNSGTSPCIRAYQGPSSDVSNCCSDSYKFLSKSTEETFAGLLQPEQEAASLNVFPNPANDQLTIENSAGQVRVDLFDMSARTVLTSEMQNGSNTLSVSQLKPGIYTYQIYDNQGNVLKTGKVSVVR